MNKLPIYKFGISDDEDDNTEVNFVSLVDKPAIEKNFLAFSQARQMFAIESEEQRIVTGPAMIANMPIYRKDDMGEYFAVFEADQIAKIAHRFFKKGYQGNINTDHNPASAVPDSVFFESWIVDREKGKQPLKGFEDVPDGSWFLTAKISNDAAWAKVKSGEFKGFSVEGLFQMKQPADNPDPAEAVMKQIEEILNNVT